MKKALHILTFILIGQFGISQEQYTSNYYDQGLYFGYGFHSAVPTSSVLFPSWRKGEVGVVNQPLLSEWYSPKLGGYLDVSYNFGRVRPIIVGASWNWQALVKHTHNYVRDLQVSGLFVPPVDYYLKRTARLHNYQAYLEYGFADLGEFKFFARGDIGLGHYRMANRVTYQLDIYDTISKGPKEVQNNFVLTAGLGLGARWQLTHKLSVRFMAGYQFQTTNSFVRRDYVTSAYATVTDDNFYPNKRDFSIENTYIEEGRGFNVKNEFLYFQIGFAHRLDGTGWQKFAAEKPVLYLYPEDSLEVNVTLALTDHKISHAYPAYGDGWNVVAAPNGDIIDLANNRKYYCLFWETEGRKIADDLTNGYVISGSEVRAFLEEKLEFLGLNYREANEFLIYWLPKLEVNAYNAIYFAYDEYEAISELNISPAPETLIRIMMLYEPLNAPIDLKPQDLEKAPERKGFTAVEWGGMEGGFFVKNEL
jgi:hypothetical protein